MTEERRISQRPIDISKALARVGDPAAGGLAIFVGTVRDRNEGKRVVQLEYEVYADMAERRIRDIERKAKERWPVKKMVIIHRSGKLRVGDVSVVVAVSSEHRAEAFEACRFAIEAVKRTVPIWKRESSPLGSTGWVEGPPIESLSEFNWEKRTRGSGRRPRPHPHSGG